MIEVFKILKGFMKYLVVLFSLYLLMIYAGILSYLRTNAVLI